MGREAASRLSALLRGKEPYKDKSRNGVEVPCQVPNSNRISYSGSGDEGRSIEDATKEKEGMRKGAATGSSALPRGEEPHSVGLARTRRVSRSQGGGATLATRRWGIWWQRRRKWRRKKRCAGASCEI